MANPTVAEIQASRGAATGALSWAVAGTALPTNATTALIAAYKGLGFVGPAGVIPTRDITTEDIKDMNGLTVLTLQTDFARTYQAELLQSANVDIKKMIFGTANVVTAAGSPTVGATISVQDKGQPADQGILVADVFHGAKRHRDVAGLAQPTTVEYGPMVSTGVRSYTITWAVYPDASGVYVYEYDDDGVLVP